MVGVPGRSKGCNTCRKRRVKCDESKPQCKRCIKAGFECLGYERTIQWRHTSTAPFPTTTVGVAQNSTLSSPSECSYERRRGFDMSDADEKDSSSRVSPELSLVAFETNFCTSFMYENFIWRSYGTPWLEQAAEGKLGELSLQAARALSQTNFGRFHKIKDVELRGVVLYGKCLRVLAEELTKTAAVAGGAESLVIPVLVLLMHASLHADRPGAVSHLKGIAKMLYLCGPEPFHQQPLRNAFDAARATLLVASLMSKQRLFLEDTQWHTANWPLDPTSKTQQSLLLDIFVVVPGLLEEHKSLETFSTPDDILGLDDVRANLCDRVAVLLEKLYRWRWKWQGLYGHQVSVDQNSRQRLMGRLSFERQVQAGDILLYNAVSMWLIALLWKIEPTRAWSIIESCALVATPPSDGKQYQTSFHPLRRPGASVSVRDPAMEICRVYEWLSHNHHSSPSEAEPMWLYLFPVGMAMAVLDKEEEEDEMSTTTTSNDDWIRGMLGMSPMTAGYGVGMGGSTVADFGYYLTKEAVDPDIAERVDTGEVDFWVAGKAVYDHAVNRPPERLFYE